MILIVVLIWLRGALRSGFHSRARSNSLRDAHARETMTNGVRKAVLPNCIANCIKQCPWMPQPTKA